MTANVKPEYRDRYACSSCGTGYLDCASAASCGLKCCESCDRHPERWERGTAAYSTEEVDDMWARYQGTATRP